MTDAWVIFQNLINGLSWREIFFIVMSIAAIVVATELIKLPVKKFLTSKIKNEPLRKKVNTVFMILPLILGACEGVVCQQIGQAFTQSHGISCGLIAVFIFSVVDRLLKGGPATQLKDVIKEANKDVTSAKEEFDDVINQILNQQ